MIGTGSNDRAAEEGSADGASRSEPLFDKGAYFIGKAVWGKGYSELLERLAEQKAVRAGGAMPIDIFGTGEDLGEARPFLCCTCLPCAFSSLSHGGRDVLPLKAVPDRRRGDMRASSSLLAVVAHRDRTSWRDRTFIGVSSVLCAQIKSRAAKLGLNCSFLGARDHMDDSIAGYRVFVNASTSDVVATTSAEALAMGKWCAADFVTYRLKTRGWRSTSRLWLHCQGIVQNIGTV